MRGWPIALAACAALLTGCLHDPRPPRDDSSSPFNDRTDLVKAPLRDRCVAHQHSSLRQPCDDARYLGQLYVRRLATGDQVCLEGGFGDKPGAACLARAAVVDVGQNKVLLEIREAQPNSRWYRHVMSQTWYEEGALVDLYLAERGF